MCVDLSNDDANWQVYFFINAPKDGSVDLETKNGPISVAGMSGTVKVRATNGPEYPVDHVVRINTTAITPLLSPAHVFAQPPRDQDEITRTYHQKYGVKPIGA